MTVTIELAEDVRAGLEKLGRQRGLKLDEAAADVIRRAVLTDQFEESCKLVEPYAKAAGYDREEDILRDIS